MINFFRICI